MIIRSHICYNGSEWKTEMKNPARMTIEQRAGFRACRIRIAAESGQNCRKTFFCARRKMIWRYYIMALNDNMTMLTDF